MFLCITYPVGDYEIGDTVEFQVHVFSEGEYVEPDSVNATVGPGSDNPLDVELTKTGNGFFEGSTTISKDNVASESVYLRISAAAEYNGHEIDNSISYHGEDRGWWNVRRQR
jgi:hypothetical protein